MAGSVNKVIIVGNLGRDPEIRTMQSGDKIANLRVATSESWKDRRSGEKMEKTEWHTVVIFNEHLVKVVEQYVKKGTTVYVEGQLQTRKWKDRDGNERYSTEIVLSKFKGELTMIKSSGGSGDRSSGGYDGDSEYGYGGTSTTSTRGSTAREDFSADLDDEIPF